METTEYKPTYEQLEEALNTALNRADEMNGRECGPHFSANLREVIAEVLAPPPPTYKEVTVERWECAACGKVYMGNFDGSVCNWDGCNNAAFNPLPFTRRAPVKQPVRKRVTVERVMWTDNTGNMVPLLGRFSEGSDYRQFLGKTGTLTFEWEE